MSENNHHSWLKKIAASSAAFLMFVSLSAPVMAAPIRLPHGYTRYALMHDRRSQLKRLSRTGMLKDKYTPSKRDLNRKVNLRHLSYANRRELAKFALSTINDARRQAGDKAWRYSGGAMHMAGLTAKYYDQDGASCWDKNHDTHAINKAARAVGVRAYPGINAYEDEAGLPIGNDDSGTVRSMGNIKKDLYFNIKQMLYGGYSSYYEPGQSSSLRDLRNYTEWGHARDLLSAHRYDKKNSFKYFGMAFSVTPDGRISVHMISVAPHNIIHRSRFK